LEVLKELVDEVGVDFGVVGVAGHGLEVGEDGASGWVVGGGVVHG
jgi:hypothetical protein